MNALQIILILNSWDLPQLGNITQDGMRLWMKQVTALYCAGNPAALADSCNSMYVNAQMFLLCTMDLMKASLETYGSECTTLVEYNKNLKSELTKLKDEYALHIRNCQLRSQRFVAEKEKINRKIHDLTSSSSGNRQQAEAVNNLTWANHVIRTLK